VFVLFAAFYAAEGTRFAAYLFSEGRQVYCVTVPACFSRDTHTSKQLTQFHSFRRAYGVTGSWTIVEVKGKKCKVIPVQSPTVRDSNRVCPEHKSGAVSNRSPFRVYVPFYHVFRNKMFPCFRLGRYDNGRQMVRLEGKGGGIGITYVNEPMGERRKWKGKDWGNSGP
jgi:hypothetical protein